MLPLGCPLSGGERGSPSQLPQRISEWREKEGFNKACQTKNPNINDSDGSNANSPVIGVFFKML